MNLIKFSPNKNSFINDVTTYLHRQAEEQVETNRRSEL
jgi:hypothetical protein